MATPTVRSRGSQAYEPQNHSKTTALVTVASTERATIRADARCRGDGLRPKFEGLAWSLDQMRNGAPKRALPCTAACAREEVRLDRAIAAQQARRADAAPLKAVKDAEQLSDPRRKQTFGQPSKLGGLPPGKSQSYGQDQRSAIFGVLECANSFQGEIIAMRARIAPHTARALP
eukprot:CAMPEP_0174700786 /NCGR_PEP_ID=MMETSP1094-20130205/5634_1 /TAXON_ID=156173 /ORGANISM="Chrysochromulina brevifilum, Strain UTEX LB 985" /LENGTH=173 /DNA_ID=CAMNT_0015898329 /DNA_START=108 /DNA_END=631 /DNA_ORIENTATION=+